MLVNVIYSDVVEESANAESEVESQMPAVPVDGTSQAQAGTYVLSL